MERPLTNDSGHALLLVLLLLTVITIITIPIISKMTSSAYQFQTTTQTIQRSHVKDMAITYMENAVTYAVDQVNAAEGLQSNAEAYKDAIVSELLDLLPDLQIGLVKSVQENRYQFRLQLVPAEVVTNNQIRVNYKVTVLTADEISSGDTYNEYINVAIIKE